uniref:Uncharacterized protein n=1 Tax=Corethron hystrix TaxID=216773 RepID=A0A7S1FUU5_9STRA|mmetsp:Transcript_31152/g.71228  ORF Transcript_31152/g.71228 Transcript_31152/m.71228 type:complete len:241 (+) Transcript_31152:279-1001(+)
MNPKLQDTIVILSTVTAKTAAATVRKTADTFSLAVASMVASQVKVLEAKASVTLAAAPMRRTPVAPKVRTDRGVFSRTRGSVRLLTSSTSARLTLHCTSFLDGVMAESKERSCRYLDRLEPGDQEALEREAEAAAQQEEAQPEEEAVQPSEEAEAHQEEAEVEAELPRLPETMAAGDTSNDVAKVDAEAPSEQDVPLSALPCPRRLPLLPAPLLPRPPSHCLPRPAPFTLDNNVAIFWPA